MIFLLMIFCNGWRKINLTWMTSFWSHQKDAGNLLKDLVFLEGNLPKKITRKILVLPKKEKGLCMEPMNPLSHQKKHKGKHERAHLEL